jgi:hypothetical protein
MGHLAVFLARLSTSCEWTRVRSEVGAIACLEFCWSAVDVKPQPSAAPLQQCSVHGLSAAAAGAAAAVGD